MAEKSKRSRKANGHAKRGHNSGELPPEVVDRWWVKIVAAQVAVEKAAKPLKSKKGELSAIFKAAKSDGIDVDAIKYAIKSHGRDHLDVVGFYANVGKYLRARQSPLAVQMNLFPLEPIPEISRAAIAGRRQGLRGGSIDENPYTPGSELAEAYDDAWRDGQEQVQEGLR